MLAWVRLVLARLVATFRHERDDADLRAELEAHLAMRQADLAQRGLSPAEAARQARIDLGPIDALREAHRDRRGLPFADAFGRDLRTAARSLGRDAGLTCSAVLIIGLGAAACAIVFSLVNTLLIRPLPFAAADRLV